jgi:hypothetical protein
MRITPVSRSTTTADGEIGGAGDGDQNSWVGEIYLILYPDPACHGGYQAKQHDRQATNDRTWDRENQSTKFWREPQQDRDDGGNDEQKSRIDLCGRHHTDVLGVSRHAGTAAEAGNTGPAALMCARISQRKSNGRVVGQFELSRAEVEGSSRQQHILHR